MQNEPWKPIVQTLAGALGQTPDATVLDKVLRNLDALCQQFDANSRGPVYDNVRSFTLEYIPLPSVFALLTTEHTALIEKVVGLLERLLAPIRYPGLDADFTEYLIAGLQHPHPAVQALALDQLSKYQPEDNEFAGKYVPWVLLLLSSNHGQVVKAAQELLIKVARYPSNLEALLSTDNQEIIQPLLNDDTVRFRVFELFARIAQQSLAAFEACARSEVLLRLCQEARNPDLICRLSALEAFDKLAATPAGHRFLYNHDVYSAYADILRAIHDDDVSIVLTQCSAVQFFAKLAVFPHVEFAALAAEFRLFEAMMHLLGSDNRQLKQCTVVAIGTLGSQAKGLTVMARESRLLPRLAEEYSGADADLAVSCIRGLILLLGSGDDTQLAISEILAKLYTEIKYSRTITYWVQHAKRDMEEDMSQVCIGVLGELARYAWGRQALSKNHDFMVYLFDRKANQTHTNKLAKHNLLAAILAADTLPDTPTVFDTGVHDLLTRYLREGPHYVPHEATVATQNL
ncbi:hypothetical protein IWQ60_008259 [Tieghemiomyces parasiticus]|uniref:26S proteasome non-ATPase regulatory subunit 5 n=1 Tax=Tieghemiomyces parasiticus TaxID=78921 RepID=A0A9W8DRT6_9FUNG|nr:hypothetical protein IWQ60_008259 [Tieghemiomyces parasiticus]